jgi:hypothetical protein
MPGAGYRDWVPGEVVAATTVDTYLQEQTVMQFATSAARDTALSGVLDEGLLTTQADANCLTAYSGAAWSTVGPLWGAGISWTPAVTQLGSVTVTVTDAKYWRVGRLVFAFAKLAVTGSGTGANAVAVSIPVTAANANNFIGTGSIFDTSASTFYSGVARLPTTTTVSIIAHAATGFLGATGGGFVAGLAAGDNVDLCLSYEAASDA